MVFSLRKKTTHELIYQDSWTIMEHAHECKKLCKLDWKKGEPWKQKYEFQRHSHKGKHFSWPFSIASFLALYATLKSLSRSPPDAFTAEVILSWHSKKQQTHSTLKACRQFCILFSKRNKMSCSLTYLVPMITTWKPSKPLDFCTQRERCFNKISKCSSVCRIMFFYLS